jgi:hypothetical protein
MAMKYLICRNPSATESPLPSNYQNYLVFILYLSDVYARGKLPSQAITTTPGGAPAHGSA